jgi:hypothetical protein
MPVLDPFGKREIYPTNRHPNRAKPWFLGKGDWKDRRYNGTGDWDDYSTSTENNTFTINFVNDPFIIHFGDIKGRFPVLALRHNQYPKDSENNPIIGSERDQSKLRKRGFMGTVNDWKNVEITLYFKLKGVANSAPYRLAISVRGGPHHSDGGFFGISPCWGTALYVGLSFQRIENGEYGFEGWGSITKELRHGDYARGAYSESVVTGGNIFERWIGMKGIFYTKANGNAYIEFWVDKNANNKWEPILTGEDKGAWPIGDNDQNGNFVIKENKCGGESTEQITWGGPGIIFKLDGLTRVDMKWASVREILPPEGWPVRYLLNARGVSVPFSMRSLAAEHGLLPPISLRQLTEREAELYPFP